MKIQTAPWKMRLMPKRELKLSVAQETCQIPERGNEDRTITEENCYGGGRVDNV